MYSKFIKLIVLVSLLVCCGFAGRVLYGHLSQVCRTRERSTSQLVFDTWVPIVYRLTDSNVIVFPITSFLMRSAVVNQGTLLYDNITVFNRSKSSKTF